DILAFVSGGLNGTGRLSIGVSGKVSIGVDAAGLLDIGRVVTGNNIQNSYPAAATQTGNIFGTNFDFSVANFTPQTGAARDIIGNSFDLKSVTESGAFTHNYVGFSAGSASKTMTVNTSASAAINWYGANVTLPSINTTLGSITADGYRVVIPASGSIIQTSGTATMNGVEIVAPTTSGPASGTLNAVNIGTLTSPGGGTETAINIGSGWDNILNSASIDITGAGAITGATGVTSSGTITFSGLTADRLVSTTTGGVLTTAISSANAALSVSDETGSGLLVFGTSPTLSGVPVIGDGAGNDNLSFTEEATDPACAAGDFRIWSNSSTNVLKKCQNGTITNLDTGGGGGSWSDLTNPTA
ncbi:MAG: hypothetical protein L0Y74_08640, partial [candidate division Zixibacteria bacterium]|nr:hypothetical protein [candidate division Zixibacteria bacterium]